MRPLVALALIVGCGGGGTSATPPAQPARPVAPSAPQLLGKPVADGPLEGAARDAYDKTAAALAIPLPTLGTDTAISKEAMTAWVDQRKALIVELDTALKALPAAERSALFATVLTGVMLDDFAADILAIPLPESMRKTEFAAEIEKAFRETLEASARPVAATAKEHLAKCVGLAPSASPALRVWGDHCRARVATLDELLARVKELPQPKYRPPAARAAVMKDCAGPEKMESEPDALPPDLTVKPKLLVRYDDETLYDAKNGGLRGADRTRLIAAVSKRLRKLVKLPQLTRQELAAGEALIAQRKMTRNGPVCGQAPRLTQVLGAKHRNVVIATISTVCFGMQDNDCHLDVSFKRAGTHDTAGLPETAAAVPASDTAAAWIAAADKLELGVDSAGLGGLLGGVTSGVLQAKDYGDDDPWLRLPDTLWRLTEAKLAACVDAQASFEVQLEISPAGTASVAALTPVTAPPAGAKVEACVREALAATPFPCTHDGKPAKAAFRMCVAPATK